MSSATEPVRVGQLVVVDGQPGVLRVERFLPDGRVRCLSYVDGGFVIVAPASVRPCPPGTRAAPKGTQ